jgi:predicted Ser/Thr protein kinase
MPVIRCPYCGNQMQIADNSAGKQFRCPSCKKPFAVGASQTPVTIGPGAGHTTGQRAGAPSNAPGRAPSTLSPPTECPACKEPVPPGAVSCIECGYLLQAQTAAAEEEKPNLCVNPQCKVANPTNERNCVRCNTPLPYPVGTVIHGRYRIDKFLAMGGFGCVYVATDTQGNNRTVAIKDMLCGDPGEFQIRLTFFRREAEILRSLESVGIVPRVYDLIEKGNSAQLVLEFVKGRDLLKLMEGNNNTPFPFEQVVEWGKAICDVLTYMHTRWPPLVHRDLKPENIMLLEDRRSIKMIDFGTARDIGSTAKERGKAKTVVFSAGYAPIEQRGGKPEPRSDLFALAATLYHLATGKDPQGEFTARAIETRLADPKTPIPADQRWFFELIQINLAEDLAERYLSAREFKADLERRRVTREVHCPKCQAANAVRKPYCIKCGEALTEETPCFHCGRKNRLGNRHCIYCGNKLS